MSAEVKKPTVRPWVISPEDEALFRATDATYEWLFSLPGETLRQYAGQWLAAKDCRLIATAESMEDLLTKIGDADLQLTVMRRVDKPGWTIRA